MKYKGYDIVIETTYSISVFRGPDCVYTEGSFETRKEAMAAAKEVASAQKIDDDSWED